MKTKFTQILYSFVFILVMNNVYAQEDFTPDTTDNEAPINDYLVPMLLLGVVLGYRLLKKKTEIVK